MPGQSEIRSPMKPGLLLRRPCNRTGRPHLPNYMSLPGNGVWGQEASRIEPQ